MNEVFIVAYSRTPIGSFGGVLGGFTATQLGSMSIKSAMEKINLDPNEVDEVLFGNVISANLGQAPVKQAALGAGIPNKANCTLINKVCSSGMKSIMYAAQSIQLGMADVVVAGGMESMSNIPHYIPGMRWGNKFGSSEIIDGLQKDGLVDAYGKMAMGVCADATAKKFDITRESQDQYTISSYTKSAESAKTSKFANEIHPVTLLQKKGDPIILTEDEEFKKVDFSKISNLKPIFTADGSVTAANSSTMNDGASAIILMSEKKMKELQLKPLARIVSYTDAEQEPEWFTLAPSLAAPIAIKKAGLTKNDIDYFEINEAFAVVPLTFAKVVDIDPSKMNINGGSVSLGHPLGSTGCRIVSTLSEILHQHNAKYGLAAICNGGGGASAVIIEKM